MNLVEVTLKSGAKIKVLPGEVNGLKAAGKLKSGAKAKEEKAVPKTKEEKSSVLTKADKLK